MKVPSSQDKVVLIGFMGAGKTAVGRLLAADLGWEFVDSDAEVESRLNLTVPEVFARLGEDEFRRTEREVVTEAVQGGQLVISTGGGWAEQEGSLEGLPAEALTVWLQVSAGEALRRVREGSPRPLLQREDALAFAKALLRRRVKRYALATLAFDTEALSPSQVATQIRIEMQSQGRAAESPTGTQTPLKDE